MCACCICGVLSCSYAPFKPILHCLQTISPLHVSFHRFIIPLSDPAPLPHLLPTHPPSRMTLDGRLLYLFPLACYHHLISVNLFLSLRVSVRPCCDPCDISTVTPVTLHRGGHCPLYTTHGTEVLLMRECNAHTNECKICCLRIQLCVVVCVFHWLFKSRKKRYNEKRDWKSI